MTRIAFPLGARTRRRALHGLLAALAALWAAPAPAQAPDCRMEQSTSSFATPDILAMLGRNLECLERRLDALREENAALRNRLDVVEDERGAAGAAYRNVDGTVDRKDRYLGPATFVVTGDRGGGPRSLRLDHPLLLAMCGDADGCLLTLGLTGAIAPGEPVETMFADGPCILHLDGEEGTWSLSGFCAETPLPAPTASTVAPASETEETAGTDDAAGTEPAASNADPAPASAERAGPRWGRDGDARPFGDALREGRVIHGFAGACFLAEAAPVTRRFGNAAARLGRDVQADLFLVAAGADWDPAGTFPRASLPADPRAPDFDCRLTVRD